MPPLKKGALKKILNKFESGAQVCPDMSGKPLGFASSFTAFLVLLGKVTIKNKRFTNTLTYRMLATIMSS